MQILTGTKIPSQNAAGEPLSPTLLKVGFLSLTPLDANTAAVTFGGDDNVCQGPVPFCLPALEYNPYDLNKINIKTTAPGDGVAWLAIIF